MKTALPRILLGVIATAFSLSSQSATLVNQESANIISIATVMVNLYEYQSDNQVQTVTITHTKQSAHPVDIAYSICETHWPVVRLTPYNGIRAGPTIVV